MITTFWWPLRDKDLDAAVVIGQPSTLKSPSYSGAEIAALFRLAADRGIVRTLSEECDHYVHEFVQVRVIMTKSNITELTLVEHMYDDEYVQADINEDGTNDDDDDATDDDQTRRTRTMTRLDGRRGCFRNGSCSDE